MPISIDPTIDSLAAGAARVTGLEKDTILAHWAAETSVDSFRNWLGNNPAGIRPGNPNVDKLALGTTAAGFNIFPSPVVGMQAYTVLLTKDPNYPNVRQAAKSSDPREELTAIVDSPWDAGHYTGSKKGDKLFAAYESVTGAKVGDYTKDSSPLRTDEVAKDAIDKDLKSKFVEWFGLPVLSGVEVLVVLAGVILIILLVYRMAVK